MAPLVFPAIVMSVAFLHVYVNLPFPIYGTLLSVIIASARGQSSCDSAQKMPCVSRKKSRTWTPDDSASASPRSTCR